MSDQLMNETIEYTQGLRRELIKEICGTDNKLPTDKDSAKLILSALKDMDSATLGQARARTEERHANNDELIARTMCDINRKLNGTNPFEAAPTGEDATSRPVPTLDGTDEEEFNIPSTVLEKGQVTEKVDEFLKRVGDDD